MTDMFLCWEINIFHIFNIVKNIMHNLIRDMFKKMIQSLKI